MYHYLGSFVSRYWWLVILFWIAVAWGLNAIAPRWDDVTYDGDLAYMPDRMTSVRGEALLARAFPENETKSQAAIVVERRDGPLTPIDMAVADRLADSFRQRMGDGSAYVAVWTRDTEVVGSKLLSPQTSSGQATLVLLSLSNEFMATDNINVLTEIREAFQEIQQAPDFPEGLYLGVSGSAAIGGDMLGSAKESIANTEITAVALVFVILLLVYRAPILVIIPLAAIVVSVAVATDVVAYLAYLSDQVDWLGFKIFKTTKIFVIVILYGSGTDYSLFLIARYREELERGLDRGEAIAQALGKVGDALVASAMTTVVGLAMMYFADFGKFSYSGIVIALCLLVTLAACMTLAPALLRAAGPVVFWPFGITVGGDAQRSGQGLSRFTLTALLNRFWDWASYGIVRRPVTILVVAILAMMYPAYQGLSVPITYNLLNELQEDRPSVTGTSMLRRHFAAGDIGPLTVIAYQPDGRFDTKEGEQEIARLTKVLYDLDGVTSVRSLTEPLGDRPGLSNVFSPAGRRKLAAKKHSRTKETYLTQVPELRGAVTRFDVVFEHDPFSLEAEALLNRIDVVLAGMSRDSDSPWHGAEFDLVGTTAGKRDLQAVTNSDRWRIQQLVTLAVLGVLVVILRRPLICVYLILSVLFSYLVTLGLTDMVFAWAYGATFEGLDWKVPIFLFVILVAIGEDYNIYLVTRVLEEQELHGPTEGLRRAVTYTGGIITSCGLIMAGSFLSMMTGTLRGMLELGFALSLGIMLDTFVIRTVIVPSFLAIVARRQEAKLALAKQAEDEPPATGTPSRTPRGKSVPESRVATPSSYSGSTRR